MLARLIAAAVPLAAGVAVALPGSAAAYVTPADAQQAADRAVAWYRGEQAASGDIAPGGGAPAFGGDWSMIALSNAGVNPADLKSALATPSLQDFYAGEWGASGGLPGNLSTDQARALLTGHGGGIRTAKLSASRNLLARQLRFYDGKQLGLPGTVNDDMFGLLALERNGVTELTPTLAQAVRRAQTGGGWNYTTNGGAPDVDMTGAGIGTLCAAGATAADPAVASALDYLETMQDDVSGGFVSDFFGANSDSTSWVVNGMRECGVDPQGPRWTTSTGKTPLDFLVALQKSNGAFRWLASEPDDDADNLYSTQDSVTALVGDGFGAEPAPRSDAGEPLFRAEPAVADGTVVPMGLVIDHGTETAGAERACSVRAPVGGDVADLLAGAPQADPAGCATDLRFAGEGGERRLVEVNGVSADAGRRWVVSVDGGAPRETLDAEVGLGSLVSAALVERPDAKPGPPGPAPDVALPPVTPVTPTGTRAGGQRPRLVLAKATIATGRRLRLRNGGVAIALRCGRDVSAAGCRGIVRLTYKQGRRTRVAGAAQFGLAPGERATVRVALRRAFRTLLAGSAKGRVVTIVAGTRDEPTRRTTQTRATARVLR
ncbi:hypothetical protein [Conexibacter woesei]|uniref:Uncharacterized protein n=1 Tax=Conexibacter woesei (strain DSM 14684 / CCUG 47730 / CIP 108061 / JCM 11494 / NBRC 100937 / ID131577) TaxID=469383 RepID=D3F9S8_CONWI|nr:hypothetical protein [Conexibacter woesei]ADB51140.1 hypothetical protein Cwoe_2721 [Conexibacter woesei DSM 14684]